MPQAPVQRRFQRHALSVRLEIVRKPPYPSAPIPGLTMEIAEGGFSAMVSRELEVDETVTARFPLGPLESNVSVEAIVRSKNLFRYGFEFVGLSDVMREKVAQALRVASRL